MEKNYYILIFQKYTNKKVIKEQDIQKDELSKHYIEIIIKDILNSNENLEFYKGIYIKTNKKNKTDKSEKKK